ncbi:MULTISPECIES: LuxR family transcriptional regulator [Paraburkholderia]|uniref:helix-turn-helix transcriptional regulator n=1 Tax=Paraburkholderia TaxID=1822464 RepID=UPI00224EED34|nr:MULTISPECIES: LuxR family transcriptional regulator [Paraburkholderia]MCX4161467.1 autoinducer binding domain-containing protein [Paraburkholderia megapolitana]MDN7156963.1 LuxR family transcriptional regulator [Paraburkholderia sp. CHISQ3]MDQ6494008.1 LuxR family transcriptional regulator [Paraburkholderia megapolitana]
MNDTDEEGTRFITFGDADLNGRTGTAPEPGDRLFGQLAQHLAAAPDSATRQQLVRTALRAAGFDSLCYCRVLRIGEFISRCAWFDTYSPPGWPARYAQEDFFQIDPRPGITACVEWPAAWDLDTLFSGTLAPRCETFARRFVSVAQQHGLNSGVSFGVATAHPLEHSIVMLSSAQHGRAWIVDTTLGAAYAIGTAIHAFIEARARHLLPVPSGERLSEAQRAILRFVTQGISDREMAEKLVMSPHNVRYHLRQLKKIYNAQNRVQLAYIAGRLLDD